MRGLGLIVLVAAGCGGSPVVGNWVSLHTMDGNRLDQLVATEDGSGQALLFATPENDLTRWTQFVFGGSWTDGGSSFVFDLKCQQGPCMDDDFVMTCQMVDEHNGQPFKLDCKGTGKWEKYPFDWQQDI